MNILNKENTLNDEQLAVLSKESHLAFSILVDRYKDRIFNFIRRISGLSEEDSQDALQEVFLKVYLNLNSFDSDLKFSSWIYSVARNQVISNYRKEKIRPEGNTVKVDEKLLERLVFDFNIEKEIDVKILNKQIFLVLDKLKSKWREVLILRFFEEKDYGEISDIIKKPSGTVASMLNKAKKEFRDKYQEIYN